MFYGPKRSGIRLVLFILLIPFIVACGGATTPKSSPTTNPSVTLSPTIDKSSTDTPKDSVSTPLTGQKTPTSTDASGDGTTLPEVIPAEVTGDIAAAGSSTVYPLAERMAGIFKDDQYKDQISIDQIGTGAGFERFCKTGETDIANASREIKESEIESCTAIGRTPIEFRVGTDAIAIAVSQKNDFLTDVTMEELAQIFTTATTWSEVRAEWPDEPIQRFSPGTDSGTFDFFVEEVLDPVFVKDKEADKGKGQEALLKAEPQSSEDDNILIRGITGSPYAIGYFGYAYFNENKDQLKVLSIGGVAPTEETAEDGSYPLSRPLFIYSDAKIMQEKPQVASFINYFLTNVNEEIAEVGYFPASTKALNEAKQKWLDATTQ